MNPVLQAMMDLCLALPGPVTRKDGMVVPVFIDDHELLVDDFFVTGEMKEMFMGFMHVAGDLTDFTHDRTY
ncbi:MAG: hypothetical protein HYV34_04725 [Candidatus Kerfeldbacteria bacterium]|nr:hypothetical protein [Candidatus Kerfeldbacteria bacterium]